MGKKVFIAGGSGFIGIRVCAELLRKGYEIHALLYPKASDAAVKGFIAGSVAGDILDGRDWDSVYRYIAERRIPCIISLVGSVNYRQDYETARVSNVATAERIVAMASRLRSEGILERLVFIGSVASRGFTTLRPAPDEILNETKSYYRRGLSVYSDVKREAEELVLNAVREGTLDAVIVEPGSLVGREVGGMTTTNIGLIHKIVKGIPILTGGASYTSADRAAEGIVLALEKGRKGETYLLGGENMAMKEFARMVREILGRKPGVKRPFLPVLAIPGFLARALGAMDVMVSRQQALLGNSWHFIDSSKAKGELGYLHSADDLEREIAGILEDMHTGRAASH